jgi:thiamine transport system substrate-binding protein
MKVLPALATLALLATTSLSAACSAIGEDERSSAPQSDGKITDVVLVAHDSFSLPKKLIRKWEADTGYQLVVRASGDAGELTSKLVLTQDSPTGDVAFGVDNAFAGRALAAGVFAPYDVQLPAGAEAFALEGDTEHALAPIDTGDVCVNVDTAWFTTWPRRAPSTTSSTRRTRTSSSPRAHPPVRRASRSCWPPSPPRATVGRTTGPG